MTEGHSDHGEGLAKGNWHVACFSVVCAVEWMGPLNVCGSYEERSAH